MIIPAKKLTLITLKDYERQVVKRLGELGIVQLKRISEEDAKRIRETEFKNVRELEEACIKLVEVWQSLFKAGFEEKRETYERYIELRDRLNRLYARRAELRNLKSVLAALRDLGEEELPDLGPSEELFSMLLILPKSELPKLEGSLSETGVLLKHAEISNDEALVYIIGLKEKRAEVRRLIGEVYHQEVSLPSNLPRKRDDALSIVERDLAKLEDEIKAVEEELKKLKSSLIWVIEVGGSSLDLLSKLRSEILKLHEKLRIEKAHGGEEEISVEDAGKFLKEVSGAYDSTRSRLMSVRQERENLESLVSLLDELIDAGLKPPEIEEYKDLAIFLGVIEERKLEEVRRALSGKPIALEETRLKSGDVFLVIACMRELSKEVLGVLGLFEFKDLTQLMKKLPRDLREARERAVKRLRDLRAEEEKLLAELENLRKKVAPKITGIYRSLELNLRIEEALVGTLRSEDLRIIQGWVPSDKVNWLTKRLSELQKKIEGRIAFRFEDPSPSEKVPTVLKNPKLFKIFEPIVALYGWPGHRELDPTIISGIIWTLMFGIMFPDFGQGLVIIGLGAFFAYAFKGRLLGMNSKKLGRLMIGLGISAVIFGLLVGEFFLTEVQPLFPGLRSGWIENPSNVLWLIKVAVFFGVAQIVLAMILSAAREIKYGEVLEAVFSPHGVAGVIAFSGFILTAFHFLGITVIPGVMEFPKLGMEALSSWPFILMIAGFAMMGLKSVFARESISFSLGSILEMAIAFLANTFSYARIAGFALVHAALAIVVHRMMQSNPLLGLGMGLIFLNFFALSIELLVCTIQALRLLYYEFYSKFYEGTGTPYTPWRIR